MSLFRTAAISDETISFVVPAELLSRVPDLYRAAWLCVVRGEPMEPDPLPAVHFSACCLRRHGSFLSARGASRPAWGRALVVHRRSVGWCRGWHRRCRPPSLDTILARRPGAILWATTGLHVQCLPVRQGLEVGIYWLRRMREGRVDPGFADGGLGLVVVHWAGGAGDHGHAPKSELR